MEIRKFKFDRLSVAGDVPKTLLLIMIFLQNIQNALKSTQLEAKTLTKHSQNLKLFLTLVLF